MTQEHKRGSLIQQRKSKAVRTRRGKVRHPQPFQWRMRWSHLLKVSNIGAKRWRLEETGLWGVTKRPINIMIKGAEYVETHSTELSP